MLKLSYTGAVGQDRITARGIVASFGFAALTAVCAQIAFRLPWTPVPITMQVFAVLLSGLVLGRKLGAIAQLEYVAAGLAGAPVFAGFTAGPAALAGPSGGYLVGFVLGAYAAGLLWERSRNRSLFDAVGAGMIGTALIYFAGAGWLSVYLRVIKGGSVAWPAWVCGVAPFVGVDVVKALGAGLLVTKRAAVVEQVRARCRK